MTPTLFSLIAVTLGFTALVLWVYWPGRRERYRRYGEIPLHDHDDQDPESRP